MTPETIEKAGRLLAEAAHPPARILLFGSHARGSAGVDSDLDLLVIERVVGSRHREMIRLRAALDPLGVPADVVVVTEEHVEAWGAVPGTVVHSALRGECLPRRDLRDLAEVLLTKADGDEAALEALLSQAQVPDGVLAFHAQQAVEKRLKAVLAARGRGRSQEGVRSLPRRIQARCPQRSIEAIPPSG